MAQLALVEHLYLSLLATLLPGSSCAIHGYREARTGKEAQQNAGKKQRVLHAFLRLGVGRAGRSQTSQWPQNSFRISAHHGYGGSVAKPITSS